MAGDILIRYLYPYLIKSGIGNLEQPHTCLLQSELPALSVAQRCGNKASVRSSGSPRLRWTLGYITPAHILFGMSCPRCGAELERYRLGDRVSVTCPECRYVGVSAEHGSERARTESWDEALARFRRRAREQELADEAAQALQDLDLPGSDEELRHRREAVGVLYQRLQSMGEATKSELLVGLDSTGLGYASADSFWSSAARDALRELPGVVSPNPGSSTWRYGVE